jgi:AmmeMemoRadiSam system protein B
LLVPLHAYFILSLLDGTRTMVDVQEAFSRRFGTIADADDVRAIVDTLDAHHYLESPRFAARRRDVDAAYHAAPLRPAIHAGASYPAEAAALREHLDGFFDGVGACPVDGPVQAVIAPHIDLRVGGTAYGHAYRTVAERTSATRFVVLGTAHCGGAHLFAATRKDFATPLGPVTTDRDFLARLAARVPEDLYRDELLHRTEHAVEFQIVMLRHVLGDRPFRVVPLLVSSFHELVRSGRSPGADPRVAGFVAALRATLAEDDVPTMIIAGVDFAHVGDKFGDVEGLSDELLASTEAKDRRLIAALEANDAEGFYRELAADGDRTRICGFAPMYTLLSLLDGATGRLLHYDRSSDPATRSAVTFASLAYTAGGR